MLKTPRGTKDILPSEIENWQYLESIFRKITDKYNYKELRTPIYENTEVFSRSIGEETDIVNKEMYTFLDKGGKSMTLRPEMTASLVRSVIQHNLCSQSEIQRLWYYGPFFRYERPQKGRFRQFHQFGVECLSSPFAESDVEIISLGTDLINSLNINDYTLILNSLGNQASREKYLKQLVIYYNDNKQNLSETSLIRLDKNPLRILDSKSSEDIAINQSAPFLDDYFDNESQEHFNEVRSLLDELKISYQLDRRLVRGLDYYSHTVFEFQSNILGAQDSFGGGGRYNDLFVQLGGKNTPAIGFAMGVERLLLILEKVNKIEQNNSLDVYIVNAGVENSNIISKIANQLRQNNYSVTNDLKRKNMKSQFKEANKLNSKYTLVLGQDELNKNEIIIKNMDTGNQTKVSLEQLNNISLLEY